MIQSGIAVHRRVFLGVALLLAAVASGAISAQTGSADVADPSVAKVVFHADFADPRRFSAMLTSIRNMIASYEGQLRDYDARIGFVAHGIRFVTADKLAGTPFAEDAALKKRRSELLDRLASLRDVYGVKLELCDITREQAHLPAQKLIAGVTLVPSRVVRLVELQQTGFAYIKVE